MVLMRCFCLMVLKDLLLWSLITISGLLAAMIIIIIIIIIVFIHESDVFELWIEKSEVMDPRTFPNDFYYCNLKNLLIINFLSYA